MVADWEGYPVSFAAHVPDYRCSWAGAPKCSHLAQITPELLEQAKEEGRETSERERGKEGGREKGVERGGTDKQEIE